MGRIGLETGEGWVDKCAVALGSRKSDSKTFAEALSGSRWGEWAIPMWELHIVGENGTSVACLGLLRETGIGY